MITNFDFFGSAKKAQNTQSLDWAFCAWSPRVVLTHAPVVTYTFEVKLAPFASLLDTLFNFEVKWESICTHVSSKYR